MKDNCILRKDSKVFCDIDLVSKLITDRWFRIWRFYIGHSILLIRSPKDQVHSNNVDLVFEGVVFISIPQTLGAMRVISADSEDLIKAENGLGRLLGKTEGILCFTGVGNTNHWRGSVIASFMYPSINEENCLKTRDDGIFTRYKE